MTPTKLATIERNLSSQARKVYDALPFDTEVTAQRVIQLMTANGHRQSFDGVEGCLNTLKREGLVKEVKPGRFIRPSVAKRALPAPMIDDVEQREDAEIFTPVEREPEPATPSATQPEPGQAPSALDRLSALSEQFRTFSRLATSLADELDAIALDVAAEAQRAEQSNQKFSQMARLMREFQAIGA